MAGQPERAAWAVTAAGYLACALRAIREGRGPEADLAREDTERAYRWVLFSIGTIPGNRTDEVVSATILRDMTVTDALGAIGA
jgi:hypothetical protein